MSIHGGVDRAEVDAAWTSEINGRIDAVRSGRAKTLTPEELDGYLDERRSARGM